jgi:hypothetical protein
MTDRAVDPPGATATAGAGGAAAPPPRDRGHALLAGAALLSVAIVWGLNFVPGRRGAPNPADVLPRAD